jgi:hypothetical protein
MTSLPRIKWRLAALTATILPLALISFALAQPFRPPQMPRPPVGPFGPGGPGGFGGAGPGDVTRHYKCPKCGTSWTLTQPRNAPPEQFCSKCGARLDGMDNAPPPNQRPEQDPNPNGRGEPRIPNQGPFAPNPAPNPAPNNPPQQNPFIDFGGPSNSSPSPGKANTAPVAKSSMSMWVLVILIVGGLLLLLAIAGVGAIIWMWQTTPSPGARAERRPRRPVRYDPV